VPQRVATAVWRAARNLCAGPRLRVPRRRERL